MYRDLPDFDTLVTLHKERPEELDKVRSELTDALLENTTGETRRRLEGLQFRINMELRRARTPEARFLKISSMMHESFARLNHALQDLHNPNQPEPPQVAKVIPFTPPRDRSRDH